MPYYANPSSYPPLEESYMKLLQNPSSLFTTNIENTFIEESEIPTINIHDLNNNNISSSQERNACVKLLAKAASEWGIFHVSNHGISNKLLRVMKREQARLFEMDFEKKKDLCGLPCGSYRWGTLSARCPEQFSWCEAFHVPLFETNNTCRNQDLLSLREVMDEIASELSTLANTVAGALSEYLIKQGGQCITKSCSKSTSFLRLNHYPKCPYPRETFGLVPHTDSCFLTIVHSNNIGRIQVIKDSKWISIIPKANSFIVNIGDLFQAWSDDIYKSVEHRVMIREKIERHSIAYFMCPSYQSTIGSCTGISSIYRNFTLGEFRKEVENDVKQLGCKVGLPRFKL